MSQIRNVLIQEFSPSYDNLSSVKTRILYTLFKDGNNFTQLFFDNTTMTFNFQKAVQGIVTTLTSSPQSFSKWQTFNTMCTETTTGMIMYIKKNNGTLERYPTTGDNGSASYFDGTCNLYPLTGNYSGNEADAFVSSIRIIKDKIFSEDDVASILAGTHINFPSGELFDINAVSLNVGARRSNGIITLTATGDNKQSLSPAITVLPNNMYSIIGQGTGLLRISEYYNTILVKQHDTVPITSGETFITQSNTNNVKVALTNVGTGIFTFSNISMKLKMQL